MVEESHPPPLQLDADETVCGDIVANSTVGVPEHITVRVD